MRRLIVLVVGLLITGCTIIGPAQPNCDEMSSIQRQISREASPEQMRAWIAETYHLTPDSITLTELPRQQAHLLEWRQNDRWYNMSIEKGVVNNAGVDPRGLTAAGVIACLGQPSHYSAMYGFETEGGKQLDLNLLFPEHGILAGGGRILRARPAQPPAITGDFPMNSLLFLPPSSASTLLEQAHEIYSPPVRQQMLNAYKSWPGDWKNVQITPFVSPP